MPAVQRGCVVKRGSWLARWRDETGRECSQGGFVCPTDARLWLNAKVAQVAAIRRGDFEPVTPNGRSIREMADLLEKLHDVGFEGAMIAESAEDSFGTRGKYNRLARTLQENPGVAIEIPYVHQGTANVQAVKFNRGDYGRGFTASTRFSYGKRMTYLVVIYDAAD